MWASMNVGATSEEEYGNYYAWGETETKETYDSSTYSLSGVSIDDFSGETTYDAATANWGTSWRTPTQKEINELVTGCSWKWSTVQDEDGNDVYGYYVTGNGNSIFLPAAGNGSSLTTVGKYGYYWSSTHYSTGTSYAYALYFTSNSSSKNAAGNFRRYNGYPVRAVCDKVDE